MLTLPLPLTLTRFPRPYYGRIFALLFSGFQATRYLVIAPSSARTLPSYHPNAALLRLPGGLPGLLLRVGPPARGGPAALARAHAALRRGVLRALHRVRAVARRGAAAPDRSAGGRRGQGAPGGATATRGEYCGEEAYATQGSNPRLAEPRENPGRTHACEPSLGQSRGSSGGARASSNSTRSAISSPPDGSSGRCWSTAHPTLPQWSTRRT